MEAPRPQPGTSPPDLARAMGGESPAIEQLIAAISGTASAPIYSSPWQQIGSAMAGYGAGFAGRPNPVLKQLLDRREDDLNRQVQMADLRLKLRREAREEESSLFNVFGTLVKSEFPAARDMGLKGITGLLSKRGYQMDPGFKSDLLFGDLKHEEILDIVRLIDGGATDATIASIKPNVNPRIIQSLRSSPDLVYGFSGKTKEDREKAKVEQEKAGLELLFKRYGIDGTSTQANGIRQMAFKLYGKTFEKLSEPEQKTVIDQFSTTEPAKLSDISTTRGQFLSQSKIFTEVRDAYARIMSVARESSYAGDIALLTSYMKLIDPSTGVKEGEFATAANAGNVPERIRAIYNRLLTTKGMLSNNQRMDFVGKAFEIFAGHRTTQIGTEKEFRGVAERAKMDPRDVVLDLIGPWRTTEMPARRIQVRSKKDPKRTGWVVLKPGQTLPPDAEEME